MLRPSPCLAMIPKRPDTSVAFFTSALLLAVQTLSPFTANPPTRNRTGNSSSKFVLRRAPYLSRRQATSLSFQRNETLHTCFRWPLKAAFRLFAHLWDRFPRCASGGQPLPPRSPITDSDPCKPVRFFKRSSQLRPYKVRVAHAFISVRLALQINGVHGPTQNHHGLGEQN